MEGIEIEAELLSSIVPSSVDDKLATVDLQES